MHTIQEVLKNSTEYLQKKGLENARQKVERLLSHVLQLPRVDLYLNFEKPIEEKELEILRTSLQRLGKGEPLAQVLGSVEFYHCQIVITPDVLIPRPETEELVEKLAKEVKGGELWDICTGSGCIAIALKKACPSLHVVAVDISEKALAVAKMNAALNDVTIEFLQGDLFSPLIERKADVIVSNPPYVSKNEYDTLDPSVRDFEPKLALLGGEDGLEFYRRFQKEIKNYLKPKGRFLAEIGATQSEKIVSLFGEGTILSDMSGKKRFFSLENE